jgi:hypothetical protein
MSSKAIFAQQCFSTMVLSHSCTNVATRMVEAQGCPGLVASAAGGGPWGKAPGATIAGDQAPTKQASCERTWVVKFQGLNKRIPVGTKRRGH